MSDLLANPSVKIAEALEKKLRNLEKRRSKLLSIKVDLDNGTKLSEEQLEALSKMGEVELQIDYVKEMSKLVQQQQKQYLRAKKLHQDSLEKTNRELATNNVKHYLQYQEVFKLLGRKNLWASFQTPEFNLLAEDLDSFEKISRETDTSVGRFDSFANWDKQTKNVAQLLQQVDSAQQTVVSNGFTGARIKEIVDGLVDSQFFREFSFAGESTKTDKVNADEFSVNEFRQESADENVIEPPENEVPVEPIESKPDEALDDSPQAGSNGGSTDGSFVVVNTPQNEGDAITPIGNDECNGLNSDVNHIQNSDEAVIVNGNQPVLSSDVVEINSDKPIEDGLNTTNNDVLANGVPPRNVNGYRRNGNYRSHQTGNFKRGLHQTGTFKNNFKNGNRNGRPKFNCQNGDEENQALEHARDSSKSGSASGDNNGFVRAGNLKRRNHEQNGGNNFNRNYRRRDSPPNASNGDNNKNSVNGHQDQVPKHKVNRTKSNNFASGQNVGSNSSEERKPRYRQNYECGFRFAV